MNTKRIISPGDKFNRLTVIEKTNEKYKNSNSYLYKCVCDCGNIKFATSTMLKLNRVKSCGCLQKEISSNFMKELRNKQKGEIDMNNLELKNILITFVNDNENIINSLENDLEFLMEQKDDEVDKEGISEQINEQIYFRNDLIGSAKYILKEIDK